jgi:hypothetical protein
MNFLSDQPDKRIDEIDQMNLLSFDALSEGQPGHTLLMQG